MAYRITSAPSRSVARKLAALTATSLVALATSFAFAQQTPATPPAAKPAAPAAKPATPPAAKPSTAAPAKPAQPAQATPGAPAAGQIQQAKLPPLMFSQWIKVCPEEANQKVCLTGIEGRLEDGRLMLGAVLIDPPAEQNAKKLLQVTLPLGMVLHHGTRAILDDNQPITAPYATCTPNGCISIYEVSPETLAKLKKGKTLSIQAIAAFGAFTVPVSLTDFAKAYDGPPSDPKVLAERQKKLEEELKRKGEELQKKANEARQKLEQGQAQQPAKPQ